MYGTKAKNPSTGDRISRKGCKVSDGGFDAALDHNNPGGPQKIASSYEPKRACHR
jgi:hypothetical protein